MKSKEQHFKEYITATGSESGFEEYYKVQPGALIEYNAYGLMKTTDGYKVHTMRMLGKKVLSHSYTEVEPKNFALNKMLGMIRMDINEDS